MIPTATVITFLSKLDTDLSKLLDTDGSTVDVHDVRILHRRIEAQLEMARLGLLDAETPE